MSELKFTLLGCGHSGGTPAIGNYWGACDPSNPRNRRTRPAALIQSQNSNLLIDAGPDIKEQINRSKIPNVDAVIITHPHADHILGLEELRTFRIRHKRQIPIYADAYTMNDVQKRFDYLFMELHDIYPKVLDPHIITPDRLYKDFEVAGISMNLFYQDHGTCQSLGIRLGNMAYSTDMRDLDQQALEILSGIETWIVDAAAYHQTENPVHANIAKVLELNQIVQAKQVFLTHMPPYMDYQTLCDELPENIRPAHDGMEFDIPSGTMLKG